MKKTNKHPLTFFREEGEKRKAMFQKGGYKTPVQNLKKAKAGIQTNGDPEDMLINKPGYGAKTTRNPLAPYAGSMNPTTTMQDLARTQIENVNAVNAANTSNALSARSAALQGTAARGVADMMSTVKKRGGAVKTKKRK
jgi:hypothetical protein